ncbi:hypothetical protein [uncultured Aeromicrobium sp.]|uniref:hypothetical protein n=1 Tax=uncultured Aeromicrobium sp. TaxID=337820 RepID=UPI0025F0BE00|nr:hypothetical protein [uncultured Aeromicrobium sp.]
MTLYMKPRLTDEKIAAMDLFDAFRLAEELLESRYPREAARVLGPVLEAEPSNAAAWELYGRAQFAAALLRPAEEAFRRLVELEPTSAWAQTALGLTLDRQSRHREGAVHHRIAAATGASERDATRVELVDRPIV